MKIYSPFYLQNTPEEVIDYYQLNKTQIKYQDIYSYLYAT